MKYLAIILFNCIALSSWADTCPYSHNSFDIEVTSKAQNIDDGYSYEYSVSNSKDSVIPVRNFFLKPNEKSTPRSPVGWKEPHFFSRSTFFGWSPKGLSKGIKPGESVSGFSLTSKGRPGIVKASFLGSNSITGVIYTKINRGKDTACPGFWDYGSRGVEDSRASVMVLGPIPSNQVSPTALYRLKADQAWTGSLETSHDALQAIDPMAKGKIDVLLLEDNDIKIEDIRIDSIKFGRGNAQPESSKIVDITMASPKYSGKALQLTFALEKVQVLCDLDRALFLGGEASKGRHVYTGVQIKPTFCDVKNWAPEVPNILKVRAQSPNE